MFSNIVVQAVVCTVCRAVCDSLLSCITDTLQVTGAVLKYRKRPANADITTRTGNFDSRRAIGKFSHLN
jgi:hypothetical protein